MSPGPARYADEDGDVTVIGSLIDGSDADGPGGAIFTLDGDVGVLDSTLIGNRADDRGGAVAGEADVLIINSTVARNLAVAHAGGGIWARHDLVLLNSTVTDNYAEGEGGGALAAGSMTVLGSTVTRNIGSVGASLGSAGPLRAFGSIIGPATVDAPTGDTRPTRRSCRVYKEPPQLECNEDATGERTEEQSRGNARPVMRAPCWSPTTPCSTTACAR